MTAKQQAAMKAALEALDQIEQWKLPETGCKWDDGTPMSYGAAHGSNGEREYIRSVSRAALKLLRECGDGWEPISEKHKDGKRWLTYPNGAGLYLGVFPIRWEFDYWVDDRGAQWHEDVLAGMQPLPLPPQEGK